MADIVVDVESDGPCPGLYSMISLGAVLVDGKFNHTFKATFAPLSGLWKHDALAISKISREEHEAYPDAIIGTAAFNGWLHATLAGLPSYDKRLTMWSDNPAYDWQWVNYYLHYFIGSNPFGFSARRIGDLYCGHKGDLRARWKFLRDTKHTHDPVDDAKGNAEALWKIKKML